MALHAQFAKVPVIFAILSRMRHIDQIIIEAGRELIACSSLIDTGRRTAGH